MLPRDEAVIRRAKRAEFHPSYPWRDEFLLVRPDQHIAWRGR